jgi:hypothetical protein
VPPSRCSYQYTIVYADEDVAACRFAYYHIHTRGSLPVGLTMDASQSLWFTGVDKIGLLLP